jgi:flagellar export protein FliJ
MMNAGRLDRLRRLRARLREQAAEELAHRKVALAGLDAELARVRRCEDAARVGPEEGSGDDVALAWAYADRFARRAAVLGAERTRVLVSIDEARDRVAARRREEGQLARLGERVAARVAEAERRTAASVLDELAIRAHGGTR